MENNGLKRTKILKRSFQQYINYNCILLFCLTYTLVPGITQWTLTTNIPSATLNWCHSFVVVSICIESMRESRAWFGISSEKQQRYSSIVSVCQYRFWNNLPLLLSFVSRCLSPKITSNQQITSDVFKVVIVK